MTALIVPGEATAARSRLPFTVIDQAVHLFDTPAEPWGIQLEIAVGGHLGDDRLRAAVRHAVAAHPMTRARQLPARQSERTWTWEIGPSLDLDPMRVVTCLDDAAIGDVRDRLYSRQVPLVESPPFRLVLVHHPEGDRLLLNANHAAFDGFGCLRLLQSVAHRYAGRADPPAPIELEDARDVRRQLAAPDRRTRARRLRLLARWATDLVRPPTRLAPDGDEPGPGYRVHVCALTESQTQGLRAEGPTVNVLMVAALFQAVEGWNREHGREAGRVSLLIPINLRPREWRRDVVTNIVLETRVATNRGDRRDAQTLLAAVKAQSQRVKEGGAAALIEVIGGWSSLPLWTKQPLTALFSITGNRMVSTAIASNLGVLSEPPDFGPDAGPTRAAWFSAPARMPCGLSVGAVTVAGRLHLSFRARLPLLGRAALGRFADRFVDDLLALTEAGR